MKSKMDSFRNRRTHIDADNKEVRTLGDITKHDRDVLVDTDRRTQGRDDVVTEALSHAAEANLAEQRFVEQREAKNEDAERDLQQDIAREEEETKGILRKLDSSRGNRFFKVTNNPRKVLNGRLSELKRISRSEVKKSTPYTVAEAVILGATGIAMASGAMDATLTHAKERIQNESVTVQWEDPKYSDTHSTDADGHEIVMTKIAPHAQLDITHDGDHFSGVIHVLLNEESTDVIQTGEQTKPEITVADVVRGVSEGIGAVEVDELTHSILNRREQESTEKKKEEN